MDIVQQAKDAAVEAIDADFQRVFAAWQKMAPWQHSEKGGAGSGNFNHSGRPGQRGGSDDSGGGSSPSTGGNSADTAKPAGKPTGVSSRPVSRTQAMQIAKQRLGAGEPGNFLANNAGKHFYQLGFKGPVIKQLYDLSQLYKAGGQQQKVAVDRIMTALSDDSELGDALRAQIDTETELAKAKGGGSAFNPKLPTAKQGSGKKGKNQAEEQQKIEDAYNKRKKAEEVAGQKKDALRAQAKEQAKRQGKVGQTVYLGSSPIQTVTDNGDTVTTGEREPIAWAAILDNYYVLAGLGISYGKQGQITLLQKDAVPSRKGSAKGGAGSGYYGHAGRPGERGGSAPRGLGLPDVAASDPINRIFSDNVAADDPLNLMFADLPRPAKKEPPPPPKPKTFDYNSRVRIAGDLDALKRYGFTPEDLGAIVDLEDLKARVEIEEDGDFGLAISGRWMDGMKVAGTFIRQLDPDGKSARLELLSFTDEYLDKGLGTTAARAWFRALAKNGYEKAHLLADLTIGRYAWAKEGAQYEDPRHINVVNNRFKSWLTAKEIPGLDDWTPDFRTPQDVASYKHPTGYRLKGSNIANNDVPQDMNLDLGKAFMLDVERGHDSWDAVIDLTTWKGR